MHQHASQTWSTASLLFVMLLTVATVGRFRSYTATEGRTHAIGAPVRVARSTSDTHPAASRARRTGPTPVPSGAAPGIARDVRGRGAALMLLMLMGPGSRSAIGAR